MIPSNSDSNRKVWKKLSDHDVISLDNLLQNNDLLSIAKILKEVCQKNHANIIKEINGNPGDEDALIRGSVHLIQLSNRIIYQACLFLGNENVDNSLEDLADSKNAHDLAVLALMRFNSASTMLSLIASEKDAKTIEEMLSEFIEE
jgi:hypothetical protein